MPGKLPCMKHGGKRLVGVFIELKIWKNKLSPIIQDGCPPQCTYLLTFMLGLETSHFDIATSQSPSSSNSGGRQILT